MDWGIVASALGGVGLALTGSAQLYGAKWKKREITLSYHDRIIAALQVREESLTRRVDRLEAENGELQAQHMADMLEKQELRHRIEVLEGRTTP